MNKNPDGTSSKKSISKDRLNRIAWDVGHRYPVRPTTDQLALYMVHPRLALIHWHIGEGSIETLRARLGGGFHNCRFIVRVYDVTDVIFDGHNAHASFDIEAQGLSGNHYFGIGKTARNYLAHAGMRCSDGSFHPLAQSETVLFDREGPSRNYRTNGLFSGGLFSGGHMKMDFEVENIFDARIFEKLNSAILESGEKRPPSVAVVFADIEQGAGGGTRTYVDRHIERYLPALRKFGADIRPYACEIRWEENRVLEQLWETSGKVFSEIKEAHAKRRFDLIHCHDWLASPVGLMAKETLGLPMVLSLHSTEHERAGREAANALSSAIAGLERKAAREASLVIVPGASTAHAVIEALGVPQHKVATVAYAAEHAVAAVFLSADVRIRFGLNPDGPLVLFAGELSYESGADLFADALPTVCRSHKTAQFIIVGGGPLRGELEGRISHAGIAHRCRFAGDVRREAFDSILAASDFVVIPSRAGQDEGLARLAIGSGRPVVTTHRAGIGCVTHGKNGLVTFDNPGSIVWGIQEMLSNPLQGSMLHIAAKKTAHDAPSVENIAARHLIHYLEVLTNHGER